MGSLTVAFAEALVKALTIAVAAGIAVWIIDAVLRGRK